MVVWNEREVPMHGDPANFDEDEGVAHISCFADADHDAAQPCHDGSFYSLHYEAHVPVDDASGFGGVRYRLRLRGQIQ